MPDTSLNEEEWRPRHNPWAVALTVTLATFMEVLDTSIANVALPHIAGSLGASQEEATWVLTSYLVSSAIILPISGWISNRIGRKRFYMTCVALFTISSMLCGFAPTLPLLILARILQGLGGGGLAPSEQAILADTFSVAKRGQAFALYGMAVVVAPAIGPTLGGWITDNYKLALDLLHQPSDRPDLTLAFEPHGRRSAEHQGADKAEAAHRLHGPGAGGGRRRLHGILPRQGSGEGLVQRSR